MARILKYMQALDAARVMARSAAAAHEAKPDDATLRATYLGAVVTVLAAAAAVAKADPTLAAKMTKVTEKYSQKKERLEETDEEEESAEGSEEEEEESAAESTQKSSEASSAASSEEEEEEEEGAAKGKRGESEEEEEEAIARGWSAAAKAYARETKGIDAYGVRGPKGLRKAVAKATGETSIEAILGALAALPRKAKADAKVAADVDALKAKGRKTDVNAIVAQAKADGRATTHELRAELRTIGMTQGPKYLRGFVAKLPKIRTREDGGRIPRTDALGNPQNVPSDEQQTREMAMADLSPEQRKTYEETRAKVAASRANGAPPR